jgi:hypothetical protein
MKIKTTKLLIIALGILAASGFGVLSKPIVKAQTEENKMTVGMPGYEGVETIPGDSIEVGPGDSVSIAAERTFGYATTGVDPDPPQQPCSEKGSVTYGGMQHAYSDWGWKDGDGNGAYEGYYYGGPGAGGSGGYTYYGDWTYDSGPHTYTFNAPQTPGTYHVTVESGVYEWSYVQLTSCTQDYIYEVWDFQDVKSKVITIVVRGDFAGSGTIVVTRDNPKIEWSLNGGSPDCASSKQTGCDSYPSKSFSAKSGRYFLYPIEYGYDLVPNGVDNDGTALKPFTKFLSKLMNTANASQCEADHVSCLLTTDGVVHYNIHSSNLKPNACTVQVKGFVNGAQAPTHAQFRLWGGMENSGHTDDTGDSSYTVLTESSGTWMYVIPESEVGSTVPKLRLESVTAEGPNGGTCYPDSKVTFNMNYKSEPVLEVK